MGVEQIAVWCMMLVTGLLVPVMMLGFGAYFAANDPGKINQWMGYRTRRSRQSEEAWRFAHRVFGELWKKLGVWMLAGTVVCFAVLWKFAPPQELIALWGGVVIFAQTGGLLLSILPVENALKKNFDGKGNRRPPKP